MVDSEPSFKSNQGHGPCLQDLWGHIQDFHEFQNWDSGQHVEGLFKINHPSSEGLLCILGYFDCAHDLIPDVRCLSARDIACTCCWDQWLKVIENWRARMDPQVRKTTGSTVMGRKRPVLEAPGILANEATIPTVSSLGHGRLPQRR